MRGRRHLDSILVVDCRGGDGGMDRKFICHIPCFWCSVLGFCVLDIERGDQWMRKGANIWDVLNGKGSTI